MFSGVLLMHLLEQGFPSCVTQAGAGAEWFSDVKQGAAERVGDPAVTAPPFDNDTHRV